MNRYIGEAYSKAQEKLEDDMKEFYRQDNTRKPLISLSSGQLTAAIAEEEEEILRAQVCEVKSDKVKVRLDHSTSKYTIKPKFCGHLTLTLISIKKKHTQLVPLLL